MSDVVLQLQNVHKSYNRKKVLDGVDLALPAGSVMGLLGKNGAGKTTLIKCALGLHKTDSGSATIFGEPVWTLSARSKARLGYVPQELSLFHGMRVQQLVAYISAFYPHWNDALVVRLMRNWRLDPEARVGPLSIGQQQTLSIILALGHEPDLLVLDEPAASLDPEARRQFLAELLEVATAGDRSVLFSTHITSDIERVADQVALIKDGKMLLRGELEALKDSVKRLGLAAPVPFSATETNLLAAARVRMNSPIGGPNNLDELAVPPRVVLPRLLRQEVHGEHALLSVQGFSAELRDELAQHYSADVMIEDLNLEDIFLELQHA